MMSRFKLSHTARFPPDEWLLHARVLKRLNNRRQRRIVALCQIREMISEVPWFVRRV
jgi:hypothetical protein